MTYRELISKLLEQYSANLDEEAWVYNEHIDQLRPIGDAEIDENGLFFYID